MVNAVKVKSYVIIISETDSHVRNYMTFLYFIEVIMMKKYKLIFADSEVMKEDWLFYFIDYDTKISFFAFS